MAAPVSTLNFEILASCIEGIIAQPSIPAIRHRHQEAARAWGDAERRGSEPVHAT
jgi:hypothetical protein